MTIYATPFTRSDGKCTGPSTDSGFTSIDHVIDSMGQSVCVLYRPRMVVYGEGEERVLFSHTIFHIDATDSTG
jgi:hypothetical protein